MDIKQRNVRKGITIGVLVCTLMLVGFLGSYAYFINSVENNKNQEVTVETGTMALTFSDGNNGFNKELDFGESAEKTFTIENTGTKEGTVSVSWMNLINTYLEGSMTYNFLESDTEDGEYTEIVSNKNVPVSEEAEDRVLASGITIPAGVKKYYKLIINLNNTDFDQTADLQAKLETQFKMTEGILKDPTPVEKTLAKLGKRVKDGNPNFARPAVTDETADGLYAMADDYGTSYYYRGAVEDNYVKFAGFYWRITRVNGDGSVRLVYDGTRAWSNGMESSNRVVYTKVAYNSATDDNKYMGYMYGGTTGSESTSYSNATENKVSSTIKVQLDNWYKTYIFNRGYDQYISDSLFCNDRSRETNLRNISGGLFYNRGYSVAHSGYSDYGTLYKTFTRLHTETSRPSLKCPQKNDMFTVSSEIGNKALTYPIGLLSSDEISVAGGVVLTENIDYYLYKGYDYWAMSPVDFWRKNNPTCVSMFYSNGSFECEYSDAQAYLVPVININIETVSTLIGTGIASDPFRLPNDTP